jgi:hypothetical protein
MHSCTNMHLPTTCRYGSHNPPHIHAFAWRLSRHAHCPSTHSVDTHPASYAASHCITDPTIACCILAWRRLCTVHASQHMTAGCPQTAHNCCWWTPGVLVLPIKPQQHTRQHNASPASPAGKQHTRHSTHTPLAPAYTLVTTHHTEYAYICQPIQGQDAHML